MEKNIKIALAGNPNCGKTTLFNALTGSNQFVGNWPGVTVEKKEGKLKKFDGVTVVDLPGIYSLSPYTLEEVVARNFLLGERPDAILNIIDGTNLERNLYLTTQLTELGIPVVVAVNMMDIVRKNGDVINIKELSRQLGCNVMEISALKGDGFGDLKDELFKQAQPSPHFFPDDTLTDQPERVLAAEIIREKLLNLLDDEVPHGVAVCIERMHEREDSNITDIDATIYCERESHKGIIIGKKGEMLKKVSTRAREDMERFFMCKINLHCWVKVKEGWRNREGLIHNFGLDNE